MAARVSPQGTEARLALRWQPYADMPPAIRGALLDMSYQLGVNGVLEFHDMLAALAAGNYAEAHRAALDSRWAKETPKRARRVTQVFESLTPTPPSQ